MQPINFRITIDLGPDADEQERNDAVVALRNSLVKKQIGTVVRERVDAGGDGAKAGELVSDAALLAAVAVPMFGFFKAAVLAWQRQRTGRSAKVTLGEHSLELHGITQEQAVEIAEAFWKLADAPEDADGELP